MKAWLCFLLLAGIAVFAFALSGRELDWSRVGLVAPSIVMIVPDRAQPNVWYSVERTRGTLYRSRDNGESWKSTGIHHVQKVMVHHASSEVYVLREISYRKNELLSSEDFGATFQLRSRKAPDEIFSHTTDPKILWGSSPSGGYDLSVSYNRGADWVDFTNLPYKLDKKYEIGGDLVRPDGYYLASVLVSPFDPDTVYVSTSVEFPYSCSAYEIQLELVSRNGGRSWASATAPLARYIYDPAFPDRAFSVGYPETRIFTTDGWEKLTDQRFNMILSVPGRPDLLHGLNYGKHWISRDGGARWGRVNLGPRIGSVLQTRSHPSDSLLAGTSGSGVSIIDASRSMRFVTQGFREANVQKVASAPRSNIVYAAAGSLLFRSQNGGETWTDITDNVSKRGVDSGALAVNPRDARHLFVVVRDSYGLVSFDTGKTWSRLPVNSLGGPFFNADSSIVYFSRGSRLLKSSDGGRTLQELPAEFGSYIRSLAVDPFNGYLYAATYQGLFLSRDDGMTAEQIALELSPECQTCLSFYQIVAIPQRGQYLAVAEYALYKSLNQGVTWQKVSPVRGEIHLADERGQHLYQIGYGLLESIDGGRTWDNISASVHPALADSDKYYVYGMTDPRSLPTYVATSIGVFQGR